MSVEFNEAWLRAYCERTGRPIPDGAGVAQSKATAKKGRSKYGNRKTEREGRVFDSKHEAEIYDELTLRVKAGDLLGVFCQHPFRLPGGVVYIADFVTLNPDGTYTVMDAKSIATSRDKSYRIKKRQMLHCLGIEIQEV